MYGIIICKGNILLVHDKAHSFIKHKLELNIQLITVLFKLRCHYLLKYFAHRLQILCADFAHLF